MKTKKRPLRKIVDYYTDPRKPLWPHFVGMLLPLFICCIGIFFGLSSIRLLFIDSAATDGVVFFLRPETRHDGRESSVTVAQYAVGETKYRSAAAKKKPHVAEGK